MRFQDWCSRYLIDPDTGESWKPWPYQLVALENRSSRKFQRWARRTGKTKALAAEVLHYAHTFEAEYPGTALVLAPQKAHLANLFDTIRAFLSASPELNKLICRNKQGNPQIISFASASDRLVPDFTIKGIACGEGGLSARGQDADKIFLEEAAWISGNVLNHVAMPILLTHERIELSAYSTPSGLEDWFYHKCIEYGAHHVPVHSRPDMNDERMESINKEFENCPEAWLHQAVAL